MPAISVPADDPDANLGSMIFDALRASVDGEIGTRFARYVRKHHTDRWLIFSDYVLGQRGRPNDVFAFTVAAAGDYFTSLFNEVEASARRDFKDAKEISEPMIRLLHDSRLFSFCFIADPKKTVTRNAPTIRGMFDRSIARLSEKPDSHLRGRDIKRLKALRTKAASPGFNVRLFDNIVLAAALAGFVTYLICDTRRASRVGWFSDRDSITTAYDAFAHYLYASNVIVFSQRHLNGWVGPFLGVGGMVENDETPWCDAFVRVPDHLAGIVSALDFEGDAIPEPRKYRQVLIDGIASNANVQLLRLLIKCENDRISASAQPIAVTRK
jgi:hypothetical protein